MLREYGIGLGDRGFVKDGYKNLNLPMSMDIQDVIVLELIKNDEYLADNSLEFNEYANKIIDIFGRAITCVINETDNPIETLRVITNILFTKKYVVPCADDETIKKFAHCTEMDLANAKKLIEIIIEEMNKDNYDEYNIVFIKDIIGAYSDKYSFIKLESHKKLAHALIND